MSSTRSNSRVSKRGSMSSSSTRPSATTTTTRTTGPYNRNFQQHLIDNGVYPPTYRYPNGQVPAQPDNWEEINQRLTQPRPSLLPSRFSKEEHQEFVQADADAAKEKQVSTSVIPIIERYVGDAKCVSGGIRFTNLDDLTDGTLAPGNPDVYHGARPEQLDRRVRDELSGQIIPSTQDDLPIIPNFFLAAKGPDGSAAVARRQACYDGALGTRGMQSLQSYRQEGAVFDNNAYTITSTYQDGQLKIYTSHPLQSSISGTRPQYCMNLLRSFAMTDTVDTFRQGATAYRNARDWAKEQRENTIREANQRASDSQVETLGIDAKSNRISSRGSEITVEESPRLSQESRNLLNETSSTATDLQASSGSQRKRQNTGESDYDLLQQPELDLLEPSGSSQQLGYQTLEQEQDSQLNDLDSQPLTPNTSKRAKR